MRHAAGRHFKSDAARRYAAHVNMAIAQQGAKRKLEGPIAVDWLFFPPDRRARDSDNVRKTLADALTAAGVWVDDSNRVIRREVIEWGDVVKGGRIEVCIRALSDGQNAAR